MAELNPPMPAPAISACLFMTPIRQAVLTCGTSLLHWPHQGSATNWRLIVYRANRDLADLIGGESQAHNSDRHDEHFALDWRLYLDKYHTRWSSKNDYSCGCGT